MLATRIDKRTARKRYESGQPVAFSNTGDSQTIQDGCWWTPETLGMTFDRAAESPNSQLTMYYYAPKEI